MHFFTCNRATAPPAPPSPCQPARMASSAACFNPRRAVHAQVHLVVHRMIEAAMSPGGKECVAKAVADALPGAVRTCALPAAEATEQLQHVFTLACALNHRPYDRPRLLAPRPLLESSSFRTT